MIEYEKTSVGDPVGRVFYKNGEVYRGIYQDAVCEIKKMFECGLIDELNELGYIPFTTISSYSTEEFPLILHHEKINDPSYIQEWTFSMIKDAALFIIKLERKILEYGYHLKDCHAYNVMFKENKPCYVDIGSFIQFNNIGGSIREFYAYYDQILEMFSNVPSIARERLISRYNIGVRYNLYYLYGFVEGKKQFEKVNNNFLCLAQSKDINLLNNLLEEEEEKISNYKIVEKSPWGDYQDGYTDVIEKIDYDQNVRFLEIVDICKRLRVQSVLELAANQGILSRMLADAPEISNIIATDYDEDAIDKLYQYLACQDAKITCKRKIHPMLYDVTSEYVPVISLKNFEQRTKSDVVIACALTHHLILGQYVDIDSIIQKVYNLTNKYLIIEFMPLGLWDGGEILPQIPDWYTEEWFLQHLHEKFVVLEKKETLKNRILIVAEKIDDKKI